MALDSNWKGHTGPDSVITKWLATTRGDCWVPFRPRKLGNQRILSTRGIFINDEEELSLPLLRRLSEILNAFQTGGIK